MLAGLPLIAFVSTTDAGRAAWFFRDVLGLKLASESPFALEFECAGTMLRVTPVDKVAPAPYTVLGWRVPDIATTVRSLAEAGVHLEKFAGMAQSDDGIWTAPSGAKIAWFKDPDGNLLSVSQF
jgi:catechol 2,3-dioxygenase-like lactoylglutathione lyase family enzyme